MNRWHKLRLLMEKADKPTDMGGAGTPTTPTAPNVTDNTDANAAAAGNEPAKHTDTPADGGKKSLLGGAVEDVVSSDDSAGKHPDGGNEPGDGKNNPTADPYEGLKLADASAVDDVQLANYKALAKELNLTPESAQRILDFEAERLAAGAEQAAKDWQEQVKTEYGDKLPAVMATCARAMNTFGGDELRELLDQTGLGNHPVMVKAFHKAGKMLEEDKHLSPNGTVHDATFTEALYGRSK